MDAAEEANIVVVNKGKRTKRQRPCSPASAMNLMGYSSSSSSGEEGEDRYFPSPSAEFTDSTEEEEDMANCLILLAQGTQGCSTRRIIDDFRHPPHKRIGDEGVVNYKLGSRKLGGEAPKNGFYLYKCKTCNRCFPSFQALGGHRASHKKPKTASAVVVEEKKSLMLDEDQFTNHNLSTTNTMPTAAAATTTTSTVPSLGLHLGNRSPNNKAKVHECSVCGSEFSSGQALGGHMRRHRPSITATAINMDSIASESDQEVVIKKERNVLSLDLNLPAPEDDNNNNNNNSNRESKFSFNPKQPPTPPPLVFSASALVDCHY